MNCKILNYTAPRKPEFVLKTIDPPKGMNVITVL